MNYYIRHFSTGIIHISNDGVWLCRPNDAPVQEIPMKGEVQSEHICKKCAKKYARLNELQKAA